MKRPPTRLVLIVVVLVIVCGVVAWQIRPGDSIHQAGNTAAAADEISPESPDVVQLAAEKQRLAGIEVSPAEVRALQPSLTVPGRLQYDDTRHVAVKVPTAGIVVSILVHTGQQVSQGQTLAVLSSPEVGAARADVLQRRGEHDLAYQHLRWQGGTFQGVQRLVDAIRAGRGVAEIEEDLQNATLGMHRDELMSAYNRYRLAESALSSASSLSDSGVLAGKVIRERQSERDTAHAALLAANEETLFQAKQDLAQAQLRTDDAERRLRISEQHLQTLLGYEDQKPTDKQTSLSTVEVRSPIGGTVEARMLSATERAAQGDTLFVVADTSQMWVVADVREREWNALKVSPGQELQVTTPALPELVFTATVEYVGREVSPGSNAVPLVAKISNEQGLLRPGLFARVRLPLQPSEKVLAVPDSAVVTHEGQPFVFVAQADDRFRRVDVETGIDQDGWIEIRHGLTDQAHVVTAGAFFLKSELLLSGEDE